MPTLVRQVVVLIAAMLIAFASLLGFSGGLALADPYDDGDGTVDVAPEIVEPVQQDAPEPAAAPEPEPAAVPDEPAPAAGEPAPEPQAPGGTPEEPGPAGEAPGGAPEPNSGGGSEPAQEPNSGGGTEPAQQPNSGGSNPEPSSGGNATSAGADADESPDILNADITPTTDSDVNAALAAAPALADITHADVTTVTEMRESIESYLSASASVSVTQWSSAWVQYDQWYQPIIVNPFPTAIRIAYTYDSGPYIVSIPPLGRSILNVPQRGLYNFTALVPNQSGGVSNVAVGSFSGGGYVPKPGQPPPPKPANPQVFKNVLVRFNFGNVQYKPVVVKSVVDLGDDAKTGSRKVLLDAETPAWGTWDANTSSGQRVFTVTLTQSLPGLTEPAATAPPGYKLTAAEKPIAQAEGHDATPAWIGLAVGGAAIVAVAIVVVVMMRRRRRTSA